MRKSAGRAPSVTSTVSGDTGLLDEPASEDALEWPFSVTGGNADGAVVVACRAALITGLAALLLRGMTLTERCILGSADSLGEALL